MRCEHNSRSMNGMAEGHGSTALLACTTDMTSQCMVCCQHIVLLCCFCCLLQCPGGPCVVQQQWQRQLWVMRRVTSPVTQRQMTCHCHR
jgi:hypothetical protein